MNKIDYIKKEQRVLDSVLMNILEKMSEYKNAINFNKRNIELLLSHFKEAGYSDAKSSITQMTATKESVGSSRHFLDILEKSLDNPYFGKIELKENGDAYISEALHAGIIDRSYKIVSWKDSIDQSAGIVKVYYSSNVVPKDVSWGGGSNKKFNDTLIGKLQIDINCFKITDLPIFLISGISDIDQSNQWIDAIRKILEVNTKVGDINHIVKSISAEEFDIIELPFNKSIHIQGAAGTGKTQIALHRISYVIFNRKLHDYDYVFFSPNKFLLKSIEKVLPSLGDTNLGNRVYDDVLGECLRTKLPKTNKIETFSNFLKGYYVPGTFNQKEFNAIKYKMSNEFLQFLDEKITYYNEYPFFIDDLELPRIFDKNNLTQVFVDGFRNGVLVSSIIETAIVKIIEESKLKFDDDKITSLKRSLLTFYHQTQAVFDAYSTLNKYNLWLDFLDDSTRTDGIFQILFSSDLNIDNIYINCHKLNSFIPLNNQKLTKDTIQEITKLICIDNFIDFDSDLSVKIYDKLMDLSRKTSILRLNVEEIERNNKFHFLTDYIYDTKLIRKERLNNLYKESGNLDHIVYKLAKENNLEEDIIEKEINKIYKIKNIKRIYQIFLNELNNAAQYSFDSNSTEISYEDAIALQYIYFEINGYPLKQEQFIIIDEVQDYNSIQLKTLRKLYTKAFFNLFGDNNQNINPYQDALNPPNINGIFDIESTKSLTYSYRSTNEIIDYTNKILGISINPVRGKSGIDVIDISVDKKDIYNQLLTDLRQLIDKGYESIGVIVKDLYELQQVEQIIKQHIKNDQLAVIIEENSFVFSKVNLLPSYYTKGLEFDSVIVYNSKQNPYHVKDRNIFYTVCTRAKHELIIYNNKNFKQGA